MALFESYDIRISQIIPVLEKYGKKASLIASTLGEGPQAFCIPMVEASVSVAVAIEQAS